MEFTQTLQPSHLVPNGKVLKANNALLRLAALAHAVLLAGVVHDHAGRRAAAHHRRGRSGSRSGRSGFCARLGGCVGDVRGGVSAGGYGLRDGGAGHGGGGEGVRGDAGDDVGLAGGLVAGGARGREGEVADGTLVFGGDGGSRGYRPGGGGDGARGGDVAVLGAGVEGVCLGVGVEEGLVGC